MLQYFFREHLVVNIQKIGQSIWYQEKQEAQQSILGALSLFHYYTRGLTLKVTLLLLSRSGKLLE